MTAANVVSTSTILNGKGVIYYIDTVLLPPQSPITMATAVGLSSFVITANATGRIDFVDSLYNTTILIPSNSVLNAIPGQYPALTMADLTNVMELHIVS